MGASSEPAFELTVQNCYQTYHLSQEATLSFSLVRHSGKGLVQLF